MAAILPIPTTRTSDFLARSRLVRQIQTDQLDLFRLQNQLSTGKRIFLPSDDPVSALRAIGLQRTLERKDQFQTNVANAKDALSAAENAISDVSALLNDIRAATLGVVGDTASDEERRGVVELIDSAIGRLLGVANSQRQDTHLFGGARSTQSPYVANGAYIEYLGNEENVHNNVDIDQLFSTTLSGDEVFGGISESVSGGVDLNPHLTRQTFLSQLHAGEGISSGGAIEILGGAESKVIDLSAAHTVGDLVRLIEENAPPSLDIRVDVTAQGLRLRANSGAIVVREVADGRTAHELGILSEAASATIDGGDLNPTLRKTTPLGDLLGSKAQARVRSSGNNNDLILTATVNGAASGADPLNGVTVQFQTGVTAGNETAVYDAGAATLTVSIQAGVSTAQQVVAAINAEPSGLFRAEIDPVDAASAEDAGSGVVELGASATAEGGGGKSPDLSHGILLTNGGDSVVIDTDDAETVEDLLNLLNRPEYGLYAEISQNADRLDVRSRRSGANFAIGENGGTLAGELGLRTYTTDSRLEDFNRGVGVVTDDASSLTIELDDGLGGITIYEVDLSAATTVNDLIAAVDATTSGAVTAALASIGNGVALTDNTGGATITVRGVVAQRLGFFDESDVPQQAQANGGLTAKDRNPSEVDSLFNTFIRLKVALLDGEPSQIGEEIKRLDEDLERVTFGRSEIGSRLQNLEVLSNRLTDEDVQLREALSNELDADLAEVISNFTARQFALQASLQTSANLLQVSLLNFI